MSSSVRQTLEKSEGLPRCMLRPKKCPRPQHWYSWSHLWALGMDPMPPHQLHGTVPTTGVITEDEIKLLSESYTRISRDGKRHRFPIQNRPSLVFQWVHQASWTRPRRASG